jgi:hypothetical protein
LDVRLDSIAADEPLRGVARSSAGSVVSANSCVQKTGRAFWNRLLTPKLKGIPEDLELGVKFRVTTTVHILLDCECTDGHIGDEVDELTVPTHPIIVGVLSERVASERRVALISSGS